MAKTLMTPGVYIDEKNAFPGSVVEVATAVPAFIGYTEKATRSGKSLLKKPTKIKSFKDYIELFGGAFNPQFSLNPKSTDAEKPDKYLFTLNGTETAIDYLTNHEVYMFNSIRLFYSNGGGACYIVSVGTYADAPVAIDKPQILEGLETLKKEQEPTMVLVPDAVKLGDGCYDIYKQVLAHCNHMQSRVGIFDIYDGIEERIVGNSDVDVVTKFREKIGSEFLKYGATYYPWLETSIVSKQDLTFENLDPSIDLKTILLETDAQEIIKNYNNPAAQGASEDATADDADVPATEAAATGEKTDTEKTNFHLGLLATSPTYVNLLEELRRIINLMPPSAAMAGVYTMVDNNRGVWKSPANVSVNDVIKPSANITHDEQENLNVDAISGKSINAIRTFPGVGTLVWGGRTLDGNSLDWRYINVRRTMIMLEQSIKLALRSYVFEPNDANTWVTVKSMIDNYLTEKWKQGALAGSTPEDAFSVNIGLGNTMTSLDILEGKMLISVKLAIVRPAEFIVVSFEQQMQKS
ncbi:phage tail sheath family protein [Algibacter miyuki]|uniref:Phage tail sheath family protein n=1 Tax=Algibacter miyuki TaxID=1306933 RepID=A0ABV5H4E2_9FLAO|nr:phage tail sheath C-terminal domain-containing protein [Algibacter miyuki]MDN3663813.1 phage tail sheath C-terminal domain-containing protein [Algibacter miyuki]